MRYRRLGYRYAVVMAASRPRPLVDAWQPHTASVSMGQPAWRPPCDVIETATEVIVLVELAGVDHEQLDVLLFEDALIVEGERRLPPTHAAGVYHAAEIRQGQLRLELPLPSTIDPDRVEARYERGLLELRLPKRTAPLRPTSIPVSRPVDATAVQTATQGSAGRQRETTMDPERPEETAPRAAANDEADEATPDVAGEAVGEATPDAVDEAPAAPTGATDVPVADEVAESAEPAEDSSYSGSTDDDSAGEAPAGDGPAGDAAADAAANDGAPADATAADAAGSSQSSPVIPDILPVLPLRGGTVVFPLAVMPLFVGQERSIKLIDDVMRGDRIVALVAQTSDAPEQAGPDDLHQIGTAGVIHQMVRSPDGTIRLMIQGIERIRLGEFVQTDPYLKAHVTVAMETPSEGVETQGLRRAVIDLFRRLVPLVDELPNEIIPAAEALEDARQLVYLVASTTPLTGTVRQELLEEDVLHAKLRRLVELLQHELAVRELGQKITTETRERMTKAQREYFLREQLRAIRKELGEEDQSGDPSQLRERIDEAGLPEEARREAERELNRLQNVPPASPEHGIIRTYLDWMASLPWNRLTGGEIDVPKARAILDEDHYDLEKIKDRILEYLAVKKLRQDRQARAAELVEENSAETPAPNTQSETPTDRVAREPILCFVGPPGVGKTSLGQSIARALGRKFVRISLGGVHDEAEIRGHRRTYIGALPGRIIQAIRRAEARDPVFMLDEIDKVGADWRGDPSSALLEVLDPAQNNTFTDNYLNVGFDLSQVLFLTTANTLDTIPAPLRDRMEVLQLSGYTDAEKVQIGRTYLVPKQLAAHALRPKELSFEDEALRTVIRGYTREAGVRNLDREIATLCRKVARGIAEGNTEPVHLTPDAVVKYLGRLRFIDEVAERTQRPGVATGLAWTPSGGDVLFVEATCIPSREERLILTGMLGDVMRESAQAALSYIRAYGSRLAGPLAASASGKGRANGKNSKPRSDVQAVPPCAGLDGRVFEGSTIHLHVPAGAIPKDGPSAGVTMLTALASLATGRPVRSDLAMTGELTLRGKVLPIGGVKEKVLAAHRAGIKTLLLPRQNERDFLEDVPPELRDELEVIFVDTAEEVLQHALQPADDDDDLTPSSTDADVPAPAVGTDAASTADAPTPRPRRSRARARPTGATGPA